MITSFARELDPAGVVSKASNSLYIYVCVCVCVCVCVYIYIYIYIYNELEAFETS